MKILIVGAGIGGLTLASFLKDSTIDVEIIEKKPELGTQGFSIGLWDNGRHILNKLGLADKFDTEGTRIHTYRICDGKGNVLRNINLTDFYSSYGVAYTHISRLSVYNWLLDIVGKERIHLNTHITSIHQNNRGVEVEFETGEKKIYDIVVGADGIHSTVRTMVFGNDYESFDDWRVWYVWIESTYKQHATVTEYIEPGEFIGIFDVGPKTLAVLIAPAKHSLWDDVSGRVKRLKKVFKDEVVLTQFFDNLKNEDVMPTDLSNVRMKSLVKDKVVLLGDAGHGFEPHAGLGASMAMEDGYVLAGELMKISDTYTYEHALRSYEEIRKKRVQTARTLTNRMRAFAFIKSVWLRKFVNICAPFVPEAFFTKKYHELLREKI